MPKLIRKGQRILHKRTQARTNGATPRTTRSAASNGSTHNIEAEEEQEQEVELVEDDEDSAQPLFLGRASATPAPANYEPEHTLPSDKGPHTNTGAVDPTELPSETRRKAASRRVADAVEQARIRSLAQHASSSSSRTNIELRKGRKPILAVTEEVKSEEEPDQDDPLLASPTLTPRSAAPAAAVKKVAEVIEIKSEDEDDDAGFQIVSPPPKAKTLPQPNEGSTATPAPASTAELMPPPSSPARATTEAPVLPVTPPPKGKRQARGRNARSATASASEATRDALVGRQPSVAPSEASRSASEVPLEKPVLERIDPWPEHFLELEKTFRAINTVYSFCSARKHMATTYDTIKSSVEGLTKRPLQIFDIAQIKSLCGELIHFAYVEHDMLQVHLDSRANAEDSASNTVKRKEKSKSQFRDGLYERAAEAIASGDPYIPDNPNAVAIAAAAAAAAVDSADFRLLVVAFKT